MFAFPEALVGANGHQLCDLLAVEMNALNEKLAHRLTISKRKPRLERLLDSLEATPLQRGIFRYSFAFHTSHSFLTIGKYYVKRTEVPYSMSRTSKSTSFLSVNELAATFSVPPPDIMTLFPLQWVTETFIKAPETPSDDIFGTTEVMVNALTGVQLTYEKFVSIESLMLQSIISSEDDFNKTSAGKVKFKNLEQVATAQSQQKETAVSEKLLHYMKKKPAGDSSGSGIGDLYSLLKEEEVREKSEAQQQHRKKRRKLDEKREQVVTVSEEDGDEGGEGLGDGEVEGHSGEEDTGGEVEMDGEDISEGADDSEVSRTEDQKEGELKHYKNDLEYLQDQFTLIGIIKKIANVRQQIETDALDDDDEKHKKQKSYFEDENQNDDAYDPLTGKHLTTEALLTRRQNTLRKLQRKEAILVKKIGDRLILTKSHGTWLPRLERLALALNLHKFEKLVILSMINGIINPPPPSRYNDNHASYSVVQTLLRYFSNGIEERIAFRKFFYKSATLVQEGIIIITGVEIDSHNMKSNLIDLTQSTVDIDRRMLDFICGLDTEFSEIVDGSHLYSPNVDIDDVILPADMKKTVYECVSNFEKTKQAMVDLEVDKKFTYGRGQVILFHGASGTGKTMFANAIATKLKKKILLINFPHIGGSASSAIVKLIFRESKIHNAILFFDECESLFLSRDKGSYSVNPVLTELERHDGLSIMATNRAHEMDEAMYRRINLAIEFKKPDHLLRERIWKSLHPPKLLLDSDVNIPELSMKYELSGGFIKNVWLMALGLAVAKDRRVVNMEDLKTAATHQLRGRLSMSDFDRRIVPTRGLDDVILSKELKASLTEIVDFVKAESILFGQWGFEKQHGGSKGMTALFTGPPGCGKTMAAEAIGFDLGRPLKVINCSELMSKWVGETGKNIQAVFDEAKGVDAVMVFDEAEGLFGSRDDSGGSTSRHDTLNVGILLHHIETFPGVCVVITNLKQKIDEAFFRRFKFVLDFTLPNAENRKKIWRLLIPPECPLSKDVDFDELGRLYEMSGGAIKSAVFRACTRAALKIAEKRVVTMADLTFAGREEMKKEGKSGVVMGMYN